MLKRISSLQTYYGDNMKPTIKQTLLSQTINNPIIIDKTNTSYQCALYELRKANLGTWILKTIKSKKIIIRIK